ncbi:MAG: hypothetical protein K2I20_01425, partial [Clostridia bacterium]|nr:hypothetical protein [Clostridia bacterium]
MAAKNKKQIDTIEIEGELLNVVGYATYYSRLPLFTSFKIFNTATESARDLTVVVTGSTKLILPCEVKIEEIPNESSGEVSFPAILNPKYLAETEEVEVCTVGVKLLSGTDIVCSLSAEVTAIPIDCWSGLSGNAEMLASFVRPKLSDCQKILAEAGLQLRTWGYSSEFSGYAGTDKSGVRGAAAAVYAAIHRLNIEGEPLEDLTAFTRTGDITEILKSKAATPLQMALFVASCFEAAKLNPLILIGKNRVGVGVWLAESCFSSASQDDMQLLDKYVSEGVNNITVFEAEDLFAHKNASYATSEAHAISRLRGGDYEICIDIKRCRIGGIYPMPLKVKTAAGYELLSESSFSYDVRPEEVIDASKYVYDKAASKDSNWQRRLL